MKATAFLTMAWASSLVAHSPASAGALAMAIPIKTAAIDLMLQIIMVHSLAVNLLVLEAPITPRRIVRENR